MIIKYSLKALQKAINHALNLDPNSAVKLQALEGKLIEMVIAPLNIHFYIHIQHKTLQLLENSQATPNTIIHSSPLGLIRLSLLPASKVRSLFNDKIRISGDLELGQAIKKLFDELDIDWEGHLAQFTGDVVAHQISNMFRKGLSISRQMQTSLHENISEYLQEEALLFPSREALNDFFNDIDNLSLRVERLQAHLNLLKNYHEKN